MLTTTDKIFTVENREYGTFSEDPYGTTIPRITGMLSGVDLDILAGKIYANSPSCEPSYAKRIFRLKVLQVPGVVDPEFGKYEIEFVDGNIQNPFALRMVSDMSHRETKTWIDSELDDIKKRLSKLESFH